MFIHTFPKQELFDETRSVYVYRESFTVRLEHSLLAISKWEAEKEKPFLRSQEDHTLTEEDLLFYILCMDTTETLTMEQLYSLTADEMLLIERYMEKQSTATTFSGKPEKTKSRSKVITSEEIYYYMTALNIPFECETWNIYRLLTLIKICGIKNNPKKMKKSEVADHYAKLNQMRRAKHG